MQSAFAFDRVARLLLWLIGVRPSTCWVRVDASCFEARYGPWRLRTPLANLRCVEVTGPYRWIKAIGPRVSIADHGATFGTNARVGACICFKEPVGALAGPRRFRHPGLTVTVTDPDELAAHLREAAGIKSPCG